MLLWFVCLEFVWPWTCLWWLVVVLVIGWCVFVGLFLLLIEVILVVFICSYFFANGIVLFHFLFQHFLKLQDFVFSLPHFHLILLDWGFQVLDFTGHSFHRFLVLLDFLFLFIFGFLYPLKNFLVDWRHLNLLFSDERGTALEIMSNVTVDVSENGLPSQNFFTHVEDHRRRPNEGFGLFVFMKSRKNICHFFYFIIWVLLCVLKLSCF